ncbi:MAG: hypothetical protein C0415_03540 [Thermodesulfovibrio sp.]|nr:hypothetical protein [Thermodesulfovibrio sp.]
MMKIKNISVHVLCCVLFVLIVMSPVYVSGQETKQGVQPLQIKKNQEIQQIKPKKPVRIKLHRNANGEYSWDITGDNPDEIYRADSRLRKLLKIEK